MYLAMYYILGGILSCLLVIFLDAKEGKRADPGYYIGSFLIWPVVLPYTISKLTQQALRQYFQNKKACLEARQRAIEEEAVRITSYDQLTEPISFQELSDQSEVRSTELRK